MSESSEDDSFNKNLSKLSWNLHVEKLFKNWAKTAQSRRWCHEQAHLKFKKINYSFSIPIIVISTLAGTANVGLGSLVPEEYMVVAQVAIGFFNIFNGVLSTLQNFFRYAQLSESHYNSFMGWGRLERMIITELNLERKARRAAGDFLKICRAEVERLNEQDMIIPEDVKKIFEQKFGHLKSIELPSEIGNVDEKIDSDIEDVLSDDEVRIRISQEVERKMKAREGFDNIRKKLKTKLRDKIVQESAQKSLERRIKNATSGGGGDLQPPTKNTSGRKFGKLPTPKSLPQDARDITISVKDLVKRLENKVPQKPEITPPPSGIPLTGMINPNPSIQNLLTSSEIHLPTKVSKAIELSVDPPSVEPSQDISTSMTVTPEGSNGIFNRIENKDI